MKQNKTKLNKKINDSNKSNRRIFSSMFTFLAIFILMAVSVSAGYPELPVNLGTAGDFVILSKAGISTTGTTAITGDIGVSPIDQTALTGFSETIDSTNTFSTSPYVVGSIYAADYSPPTPTVMTTAVSDMEIAYTAAAGRTTPDFTELYAGDITGKTLTPGLYKWGTGVLISAGGVTISGTADDIFIFQILGDLTVANGAIITLNGGAQAKNIFWQVGGGTGVTLGTTSDFKGNILAIAGIVIQNGATLNGRALAQTAVTLDANAVTTPGTASSGLVLTTVTLTPTSTNMGVGSTKQLNASGFDQFGSPKGATITYTSSNTSVATVSASGLVTAVALGNTNITAKNGTINDTSAITVRATSVFTSMTLLPESADVNFGSNIQLNATALDQFEEPMVATITYGSSNLSIATVNASGFVTANDNISGTILIMATSGVLNKTSEITVRAAPHSSGGSGGSKSVYWACTAWSDCNSDGIRTRNCELVNTLTKSTENELCTPPQKNHIQTVVSPLVTTTSSIIVDSNKGGQNTTVVVNQNNGTVPKTGNQLTGQVIGQSTSKPSWWQNFSLLVVKNIQKKLRE